MNYSILTVIVGVLVCACPLAGAWVIDDCGYLVDGIEAGCILLNSDNYGPLEVLGDLGGYSVGDYVRAVGEYDPDCLTICMQGYGCLIDPEFSDCGGTVIVCGDANCNHIFDIDDPIHLIAYVLMNGPPCCSTEVCDLNCDGQVDIDDVVCMIRRIFEGDVSEECDCCP